MDGKKKECVLRKLVYSWENKKMYFQAIEKEERFEGFIFSPNKLWLGLKAKKLEKEGFTTRGVIVRFKPKKVSEW